MHDVVVVGGGPAGYATAFRAAARGLDVALVEQDKVGGTCLHRGCVPSKALLHVAGVLVELQRAEVLGLRVRFDGLDADALAAFRDGVVTRLFKGLDHLADTRATRYRGRGRVVRGDAGLEVEVTADDAELTRVQGRHVVLATGSVPRSLPGVEIDGEVVVTSDHALRRGTPPARAVIVGAGAIGMEFASMWHAMGSEVTVVEALDRVLPLEDQDSSRAVTRAFTAAGVEVVTSAAVHAVERDGATARVEVEAGGQARDLEADLVLVAVGRGPNTAGTGAAELGILDDRGFVVADAYGATQVDGLWAAGDVLPTLALAHAAFAEGIVVADRIAGVDHVRPVDHVHTPRVTYCHPEVASVGLTEAEARERFGRDAVSATTVPLRGNAKGIIHASDGHVKVVWLGDGAAVGMAGGAGPVLGVHVVGPHATELIAEASLATSWEALPQELAAITHAHPTLYEALGEGFQAAAGVPLHTV